MANANLELLQKAVQQLGELVDELVFVGGCTTGLFITDEAALAGIRSTKDVDTIVEATTYAQYIKFSERLKQYGFKEDTSPNAPLCRWIKEETILDVMPLDEKALGFTNIWYKDAIKTAQTFEIAPDVYIRVVTPVYFCATKLEAFAGRGNDDFFASHDLEDIMTVIDGRAEIVKEVFDAPADVRKYIAKSIGDLLANSKFLDALPGHLQPDDASQGRIGILTKRLNKVSTS